MRIGQLVASLDEDETEQWNTDRAYRAQVIAELAGIAAGAGRSVTLIGKSGTGSVQLTTVGND